VAWALGVWWFGEGLGGVLAGTASPVSGAPGPVLLGAAPGAEGFLRSRSFADDLPDVGPVAEIAETRFAERPDDETAVEEAVELLATCFR